MPRIVRDAEAVWEGNLARGAGALTAASTGAFSGLPFSLPSRVETTAGKTSPEELLASAHAACFAMSLAGELTKAGTPPERLDVRARVIMDQVESGDHLVVASEVTATVRAAGVTEAALAEHSQTADETCPFSVLIRASATVTIDTRLEA